MPKFETVEYILPVSWASALINGDVSGLEPDELELIEWFCLDVIAEHGNAHFSCGDLDDEKSFCKNHDVWYLMPLAADCAPFYILQEIKSDD